MTRRPAVVKQPTEAAEVIPITVQWRLSPWTNRWFAFGPCGFRFSDPPCDMPLDEAKAMLCKALGRSADG